MKKTIIFLMAVMMAASCAKNDKEKANSDQMLTAPENPAQLPPPADGKYPAVAFDTAEFDFGDIKPGDKVSHEFSFKNTGEADLIISDAFGSCGCTVPEYPKEAIKPGATGTIKVTFDSAGKKGRQQKKVTLITNTKAGREFLEVKVNINPGA